MILYESGLDVQAELLFTVIYSAKTLFLYSRTSIARTLMARLPWLIQTRFCPYEGLPIAQENRYLGKFSYFIVELYVVCSH